MNDIIKIIDKLNNNFNLNDIQDYQKLMFIIYNSIFLEENPSKAVSYKIFSLLDNKIKEFNFLDNIPLQKIEEVSIEDIYNTFLSYRLRQNKIFQDAH